MTDEREILLTRGQLIRSASIALAVASALSVLVVLPAELHYDPTGFGRATGLLRSGREQSIKADATVSALPGVLYESSRPFRNDVIDIPLGLGAELEYKVAMSTGAELVYSWNVVGEGKVYYEFHGESEPPESRVESYKTVDGAHESFGALRAPLTGIHGWYLLNDSDTPIIVRLRLSGYYELSPQFASIGRPRQL
jgi:hypothetical protein